MRYNTYRSDKIKQRIAAFRDSDNWEIVYKKYIEKLKNVDLERLQLQVRNGENTNKEDEHKEDECKEDECKKDDINRPPCKSLKNP